MVSEQGFRREKLVVFAIKATFRRSETILIHRFELICPSLAFLREDKEVSFPSHHFIVGIL